LRLVLRFAFSWEARVFMFASSFFRASICTIVSRFSIFCFSWLISSSFSFTVFCSSSTSFPSLLLAWLSSLAAVLLACAASPTVIWYDSFSFFLRYAHGQDCICACNHCFFEPHNTLQSETMRLELPS